MKGCSSLILMRQMKNKTTPRYYFSSLRLAKFKMLANVPSFDAGTITASDWHCHWYFCQFDSMHSIRNVLALSNSKLGIYKYIQVDLNV